MPQEQVDQIDQKSSDAGLHANKRWKETELNYMAPPGGQTSGWLPPVDRFDPLPLLATPNYEYAESTIIIFDACVPSIVHHLIDRVVIGCSFW